MQVAWPKGKLVKEKIDIGGRNVEACSSKGREKHAVVADLDGTLTRGRSSFPYFMLMAIEGGSILRGAVLMLVAPIVWLLYHFVSESGMAEAVAMPETELLQGLPHDVGLRCLTFIPRSHHAQLQLVCTLWRDLITRGLSSFHALRRSMGLTQDYLFSSCGEFRFAEIDISSPVPWVRTGLFPSSPTTVRLSPKISSPLPSRAWECPGRACIPVGPFVLVLGCCYPACCCGFQPSNRLHIFDISSGFCRLGASMKSWKPGFA
ncbi:hypothetical protein L7F22_031735 [Adiantum nelumboides]|nr:hypothetical protein [Adiantum nelumboides]